MNGLPPHFDGRFFVERELELVSFSQNTIFLSFDERVSLTILSSLEHDLRLSGKQSSKQSIPLSESSLMQLVGHAVTSVTTSALGTLELIFDNGQSLKVFDDLPNYECYSITHGDIEIFV